VAVRNNYCLDSLDLVDYKKYGLKMMAGQMVLYGKVMVGQIVVPNHPFLNEPPLAFRNGRYDV